jgi:hypothetical protein
VAQAGENPSSEQTLEVHGGVFASYYHTDPNPSVFPPRFSYKIILAVSRECRCKRKNVHGEGEKQKGTRERGKGKWHAEKVEVGLKI